MGGSAKEKRVKKEDERGVFQKPGNETIQGGGHGMKPQVKLERPAV